jgi:hypothetical protein
VPADAPFLGLKVTPAIMRINPGTDLWRVHPRDRSATEFNQIVADDVFGGYRFDGTSADQYSFLYAASDCETALLETLGRDVPFDHKGLRLIVRQALYRQCISAISVIKPLSLISLLSGEDLAAVCQDEWLVQCDASEYPQTRRWGSWLRKQAPAANGIVWPSRRNISHRAIVLFGDRCTNVAEVIAGTTVDLDTMEGAAYINTKLAAHHMHVHSPRRRNGSS